MQLHQLATEARRGQDLGHHAFAVAVPEHVEANILWHFPPPTIQVLFEAPPYPASPVFSQGAQHPFVLNNT